MPTFTIDCCWPVHEHRKGSSLCQDTHKAHLQNARRIDPDTDDFAILKELDRVASLPYLDRSTWSAPINFANKAMKGSINRRTFIKQASAAGVGLGVMGRLATVRGKAAPSNKVIVAVMGVNSRGRALAQTFSQTNNVEVGYLCEVDDKASATCIEALADLQEKKPQIIRDVRKLLDSPDLDALVIAAPDHWHTIAAVMALQAGKHVYLEKPGSHNAREAGLVVKAQQKYGKLVQLGTQRRSSPLYQEAIAQIKEGAIGKAYHGKAWYANTRGSIGVGKPSVIPEGLDYELWQGAAPRRPYQDNLIHYNWHWFRNWGTGEACNNGTHHVDLCRWALGVDNPSFVSSSGGRYHYQDDWEFFDTQIMSFEFEGGQSITWEGRSCNGLSYHGVSAGVSIHGTAGSMLLTDQGYMIHDLKGKEVERREIESKDNALNPVGAGVMTDQHVANFCEAIRGDAELTQPIAQGFKSPLLCHMGNIAQFSHSTLKCDPRSGKILDNPEAQKLWGRDYEPGWEPKL